MVMPEEEEEEDLLIRRPNGSYLKLSLPWQRAINRLSTHPSAQE